MAAEAAVFLVLARLAVRLVSAERVLAWAKRPLLHPRRFADPDRSAAIARCVARVAAWRWIDAVCLPQALATQAMLRRRGVASRLCLGLARQEGALSAHAWIELDGEVLIGGSSHSFTPLPLGS